MCLFIHLNHKFNGKFICSEATTDITVYKVLKPSSFEGCIESLYVSHPYTLDLLYNKPGFPESSKSQVLDTEGYHSYLYYESAFAVQQYYLYKDILL